MMSSYIETQLEILRQILLRTTPNVQNKPNHPYVTNDIGENTRRENHRSAKLLESLLEQDARQIETKSAKLLESFLEEDIDDNLNVFQANNEIFINNIPLYRYIQFHEDQKSQLNQLEPNPLEIQENRELKTAVEDSETRNELVHNPSVNEEITNGDTNRKIIKTNIDTSYDSAGQITKTNIVTNNSDEKIHKIDIDTPNKKVEDPHGNAKTSSENANRVGTIDTQTCSSTAAKNYENNKEEPIRECKNLEKLEKEYNQNIEHDTRENSDKVKLREAKEFKASEHTSQVPSQSIDTRPNMKQNVENAIGQPSLVATASKSIRDNEQLGKGGNAAYANVNFNTSNNKDVVNVPKENFTRTKENFNTSKEDVNRLSICSNIDAMSILSDTSSMHTDYGSTIQESNEPRKGKYHKRKAPRPPSYVEDSKEFFI
ncbi:hypothetical protein M8J75_005781 [Diaphorina citri]|nr:hypothetical protein M8J75_005781 [Diaphorina citri]